MNESDWKKLNITRSAWSMGVSLVLLLMSAACTGGSPPDSLPHSPTNVNRPPVIKTAKVLISDQELRVEVEAEDLDHDQISYTFQWYADGVPLSGQISPALSVSAVRRGQQITAEVTPRDPLVTGQSYRTGSVLLGNTPPHLAAVTLVPANPTPGDKIDARIDAQDRDLDRVDALYRWFVNDTLVKETEESFLMAKRLRPGDLVAVEVTVRDSGSQGNSLRSEQIEVGNGLPHIISTPPAMPSKPDRYEYLVKADDLDGDPLTYQLEAAPQGMTIGEHTGLIEWPLSSNLAGTFHVKVVARDSHGGSALQEFDLILSKIAPPKPMDTGA